MSCWTPKSSQGGQERLLRGILSLVGQLQESWKSTGGISILRLLLHFMFSCIMIGLVRAKYMQRFKSSVFCSQSLSRMQRIRLVSSDHPYPGPPLKWLSPSLDFLLFLATLRLHEEDVHHSMSFTMKSCEEPLPRHSRMRESLHGLLPSRTTHSRLCVASLHLHIHTRYLWPSPTYLHDLHTTITSTALDERPCDLNSSISNPDSSEVRRKSPLSECESEDPQSIA